MTRQLSRVPCSHGVRRVERALAGFRRSGDRAEQAPPRSRRLVDPPSVSIGELADVVHEYRHVHEDHRRAPSRSRVRRQLGVRLRELSRRFEHLLALAPVTNADRRLWRDQLRGHETRAPSPDLPPMLFRGRSEAGSELRLAPGPGGTVTASIDGATVAVLDDVDELSVTTPGFVFTMDGRQFKETFGASSAALADLREGLPTGRAPKPEYIRELTADGLIDRALGLTTRGRRALALDRRPARRPSGSQIPLTISLRGQVPVGARKNLARSLTHVVSVSPRRVLGITASLTHSANPALARPVAAKATITVTGHRVRASASAATANEAVNLLESRLHRKLCALGGHDLAQRRSPSENIGEV